MKTVFVIIALVLLSGCSRREEVAPGVETAKRDAKAIPEAVAVSIVPGNYVVYRHCIDGIAYLTFANKSIIAQVNSVGDPIRCK